jgi:hypothetical protein
VHTEAPALIDFYPKALYRTEITKTLEGFGNIDKTLRPKVMPVIRQALKDREASPLAAQIVKSWQLREAVPDVEELIRSFSNPSARENLVNTLLAFMKPQEIVETLVFLVGEDPTTQGIQVNQLAADKLKQHGVTVQDVRAALQREHVEIPGGRVETGPLELAARTKAEAEAQRA